MNIAVIERLYGQQHADVLYLHLVLCDWYIYFTLACQDLAEAKYHHEGSTWSSREDPCIVCTCKVSAKKKKIPIIYTEM